LELKKQEDWLLRNVYRIAGERCADPSYFENLGVSKFQTLIDVHNEAQQMKREQYSKKGTT